MRGLVKFMTLVACVLLVETAVLGVVVLASVTRFGGIEVIVHDRIEDHRVSFHLPAFVVNGALDLASLAAPFGRVCIEDEEAREIFPAIGIVAAEIEKAPDFTLLDVVDHESHVRIRKHHGRLQMQVRSPDANVWVQVPRSTMRRVGRLAGNV